jgi:hypothetical protein
MRFDTEEAFFRATFNAAGTSPSYIVEACNLAEHEGKDRNRALRTEVVRLMRGAFKVHQQADAQYIGDNLLEYRLNAAKEQLPDGWRLVVMFERGTIRLDVYDDSDVRHEFGSTRDTLSGQADDALRAAIDHANADEKKEDAA